MEYEGERGSDEIASCIYKWVMVKIRDPKFKKLRIISDNCPGKKIYCILCIIFNKLNILIFVFLLVIF